MGSEICIPCFAVFGLILGSFLNVCIHRSRVERRSFIRRRAARTGNRTGFDNIPVVSFLLLGGDADPAAHPSRPLPMVETIPALSLRFSSVRYFPCTAAAFWQPGGDKLHRSGSQDHPRCPVHPSVIWVWFFPSFP
jgi:hypothetical protein